MESSAGVLAQTGGPVNTVRLLEHAEQFMREVAADPCMFGYHRSQRAATWLESLETWREQQKAPVVLLAGAVNLA